MARDTGTACGLVRPIRRRLQRSPQLHGRRKNGRNRPWWHGRRSCRSAHASGARLDDRRRSSRADRALQLGYRSAELIRRERVLPALRESLAGKLLQEAAGLVLPEGRVLAAAREQLV